MGVGEVSGSADQKIGVTTLPSDEFDMMQSVLSVLCCKRLYFIFRALYLRPLVSTVLIVRPLCKRHEELRCLIA